MTSGMTFNVQQFSTEDGPGIRTTVFLKGCPLRCAWCHNPEGLRAVPDLVWHDVRCIVEDPVHGSTRDCLKVCPVGQDSILPYNGALALTPQGIKIDRTRCNVCGKCAQACPSAALEVIGRYWTPDELMGELLKDQVFYETSGGGITFSGGEPMMQSNFMSEILPLCREAGLHIALDTCGAVAWERYKRALPWVDLVLLDLKLIDAARHTAATGVSNGLILENARRIATSGVPMWIRTPVIPGYTDDMENIRAIGRFIRDALPTVERWDLLAYSNLCKSKYHRLDLPYALEEALLLTSAEMETIWQAAMELTPVARWSGATR